MVVSGFVLISKSQLSYIYTQSISALAHGEYFSTISLARACKHISACLLAFNSTAPAIWQKVMSIVLKECKGVLCYIDDILITGKMRTEHEENLRHVFQHLEQFGLRIKQSKYQIFQDSVTYLGHKISKNGIQPTAELVSSIINALTLQNKAEFKTFLGLMTYNIRFLFPLYKLVQKDVTWIWSHRHKKAFSEAKNLVSTAPVLAYYDITKPIKSYCDESPQGVGAFLMQEMDKHERPVEYGTGMLTSDKANYAQIDWL